MLIRLQEGLKDMGNEIIKKIGCDMLLVTAKNLGKALGIEVDKQSHMSSNQNVTFRIKSVENIIDLSEKNYDKTSIDSNIIYCASYVKKLLPLAGLTAGAYITIPAVVGAATFATIGAAASITAYNLTNVAVLAGGAYKISDKILKANNHKNTNDELPLPDSLVIEQVVSNLDYLEVSDNG